MLNYKVKLEESEFIELVVELKNNYSDNLDAVNCVLKYLVDDHSKAAIIGVLGGLNQFFSKSENIEERAKDYYKAYFSVEHEISNQFITELLLFRQIAEKDGYINTTFERVLNDREMAVAKLLGFEHQTNYSPYEEDKDPLGFYKRGDLISSLHLHND